MSEEKVVPGYLWAEGAIQPKVIELPNPKAKGYAGSSDERGTKAWTEKHRIAVVYDQGVRP